MSKILIVEDDISIAELERDYLEVSGYEVELSDDGKRGFYLALENDYDLIILDVMLPGMNGFDILKEIREVKDTPIIMVTARKEDMDKVRGLGLLADDYITKPFSPSELIARVKAHILRYKRLLSKSMKDNEQISLRGIKMNKNTRFVSVNGEEKVLTAKEFELLYFFLNNPNHVFSKEDLFRQIWGEQVFGAEIATVTVHIKKLREKIEINPSNPQYIETIWGVGYRFKL